MCWVVENLLAGDWQMAQGVGVHRCFGQPLTNPRNDKFLAELPRGRHPSPMASGGQ